MLGDTESVTRKWFVATAAVFLAVVLSLGFAWAVFDSGPGPGGPSVTPFPLGLRDAPAPGLYL